MFRFENNGICEKQLLDNSNTIQHYQYLEAARCKILTVLLLLRIQSSGMWCCVAGWVVPNMLRALCFLKMLRTTHLMTKHHMSDLNLLLKENTVFETVMLIVLMWTYWTAHNILSVTFCYDRNFILFQVQYLSYKWAKLIYTLILTQLTWRIGWAPNNATKMVAGI